MKEIRFLINAICAGVGWILGAFLGPLNGALLAMLAFMAADYISGVLAAAKAHEVSSNVGFWGLIRKGCMLLVVGLGNLLDVYILDGSGMVRNACCMFYISNEGISILENLVELGVKIPDKIKRILEDINKEGDNEQ